MRGGEVRAAKRDAVERGIVEGLRRCGYRVLLLDRFDLLVYGHGQFYMLDCKSPGGKPTASQEKLVAEGWPLHFVQTLEEALEIVRPESPLPALRRGGAI